MLKMKVHWQIIIALILGVAAGSALQYMLGEEAAESRWVRICEFLGTTVFIGLLKMIIVPLIFSSIVTGIAGLSGVRVEQYYGYHYRAECSELHETRAG